MSQEDNKIPVPHIDGVDNIPSDPASTAMSEDPTFSNRDVTKWVDRLERGKLFVDAANRAVDFVQEAATKDAKDIFAEEYTAHSAGNLPPTGLIVDAFIKPPVVKKLHPEGDKSAHFSQFREYPHYFTMVVSLMFNIDPVDDRMKDSANTKYYVETYKAGIEREIDSRIATSISSRLSRNYHNVFTFPKNGDFVENRINVVVTSSINFNLKGGSLKRSPIVPSKTSEDYREMLVRELSVAFGRIVPTAE